MREIRGKHQGYSWRVFYSEEDRLSTGWRGEWLAPTGEQGKTPRPLFATEQEAEAAVKTCIEEHRAPTYSEPLAETDRTQNDDRQIG